MARSDKKSRSAKTSAQGQGILMHAVIFAAAAVVGISACTMGFFNLLITDGFYGNIKIAELLQSAMRSVGSYFPPKSVLIGIFVFIALTFVFCLFLKLSDIDRFKIKPAVMITAAGLLLRAVTLVAWNLPQTSDFLMNYELSELLTTIPIGYWGRFLHEMGTQYTGVWSAHMPFILYQAIMLKAGGNLGIANAIYGTAACIFTAFTAKALFGNKAFYMALLLTAFNPVMILFTPVLTNQHIALMLLTASIWVFVAFKNVAGSAIAALILVGAQLMRPEMYVPAIAFAVYCIYLRLRFKDKGALFRAAVFILIFAAGVLLCDAAFRSGGLISGHLYNGNLKYKLCVGLNQASGGGWSEGDNELINDAAAMDRLLSERIGQSGKLRFMLGKVLYQFGSYVYPWVMDAENHPLFSNMVCRRAASAYMIIVSLIASVRLVCEHRKELMPLCLMILGYAAVYALTEIQPRYNYTFIPLITILASDIQLKK
ncbi:MAG: hypothetical protein SOS24_00205 [Clostridia bacterium]|nr:hypothetical protein [Clostridia bacterium]